MQPTGEVEANPLCFSAGPAKDGSAMVLHPLSRLVKEGVLGIVCHAVGYYEVKVCFKLLQAPVEVSINSFSHGGEVNRVLDDIQVVRYLQRTENRHQVQQSKRRKKFWFTISLFQKARWKVLSLDPLKLDFYG